MTKDNKIISVSCDTLQMGDVVVLSDGTLARISDIGGIEHVVPTKVGVNVITYDLIDGPYKGARVSSPLLFNDEVDVVKDGRHKETNGFFKRLKGLFCLI